MTTVQQAAESCTPNTKPSPRAVPGGRETQGLADLEKGIDSENRLTIDKSKQLWQRAKVAKNQSAGQLTIAPKLKMADGR